MIARSVGVSRSTVAEYLRRAAVIGLAWPIPDDLDGAALERRNRPIKARQMRKIGATRRQLFESIDEPALAALPIEPYEYAERASQNPAP